MRTRIIVGSLLTLLAAGVFYGDHVLGWPYPFLLAVSAIFGAIAAHELVSLIPPQRRPNWALAMAGTLSLLLLNWIAVHINVSHWPLIVGGLTAVMVLAFFWEMHIFQVPGESLNRVALTVLCAAYLGLLAGYFVNLRVQQQSPIDGTLAMILAIFVPKGCDIGAYFTGSFIGKHKMTPHLSPKKTWEGAAGGLLTAMAVALIVYAYQPIIPGGWMGAAAFGLVVGAMGMLGDLAESLIKRDCGSKDAANLIPGFGGVLDVIDAVLFAAPVVYVWLNYGR